jgi:hypothetical protein
MLVHVKLYSIIFLPFLIKKNVMLFIYIYIYIYIYLYTTTTSILHLNYSSILNRSLHLRSVRLHYRPGDP